MPLSLPRHSHVTCSSHPSLGPYFGHPAAHTPHSLSGPFLATPASPDRHSLGPRHSELPCHSYICSPLPHLLTTPTFAHHSHICSPLPHLLTTPTFAHHSHICSPLPHLLTTPTFAHHSHICSPLPLLSLPCQSCMASSPRPHPSPLLVTPS